MIAATLHKSDVQTFERQNFGGQPSDGQATRMKPELQNKHKPIPPAHVTQEEGDFSGDLIQAAEERQARRSEIEQWHKEGLQQADQYRRCEYNLVLLLSKIYRLRGYLLFQSASLRDYAVFAWDLPENAARDLVTVAKKAIEFPALLEVLKENKTSVSKLRKICPVLDLNQKPEENDAWIGLAVECTARVIERCVAAAKPQDTSEDQMTYKSGNRVELKAGISEEVMHKLERVRDLISTKLKKAASIEDALSLMTDLYLEKHDPVVKAQRAMSKMEKTNRAGKVKRPAENEKAATEKAGSAKAVPPSARMVSSAVRVSGARKSSAESSAVQDSEAPSAIWPKAPSHPQGSRVTCRATDQKLDQKADQNLDQKLESPLSSSHHHLRQPIPAHVEQQVNLRDQGQCAYTLPNGQRCSNRRWLEVHHIRPVVQGGGNELENLITVCHGHHSVFHFDLNTKTNALII